MKNVRILSLLLAMGMLLTACGGDAIYVDTNAFFAPFEYYQGTEIVGVDIDIMKKVGQNLGKKVVFENMVFITPSSPPIPSVFNAIFSLFLSSKAIFGLAIANEVTSSTI